MNTEQTPNFILTSNNVETPNVVSTSSEVDTRTMTDGSSSVTMLKVMVDERVESKEGKTPSSVVTESFEQVILQEENAGNSPLLQDDMFSLAELSVVENQQLDEATTVCSADIVTSVSDHCYETLPGIGQLATSISGSGENCENNLQGVTKVTELVSSLMPVDDTIGNGNIEKNIEQVIGHTKVGGVGGATNGNIGNLENDSKCVDHKPDAGNAITGRDEQVKDHTGHEGQDERESVMVKEMNDIDSTQAGMTDEQEFERGSTKEDESCQQNLPETIPCVKQAELDFNQQTEDKKSEEMEIPISRLAVSMNEETVNMDIDHPSQGPSEKLMQSKNIPQESVSIKEAIDPHEFSQNVMLLEKASENSQLTILQGEQLQETPEEFELLKGRKVCKKFGRKKYLGEVLGYDPTTKWFKVLYEDGDEEELEKNELDGILLPLDGKLVVSRKRQLPANDDGHEDANRTGRKVTKRNMQDTPSKQGKIETTGDEITGLNLLSSNTRKRKRSAVKSVGKSKGKSPKVSVTKTQKAKSQSAHAKKSIEKEKSETKSPSTQSKRKPNNQMKQSSSKKDMDVAQNQNESVTRKLKYGSATKKTSTKANQKAKDIPSKDKEVKTLQLSITEKSAPATSSRKRKAGTDVQGKASTVSGKRTRRQMLNDVDSPPLKTTESKRRRIPEDGTEVHLQVEAENNDTNDGSISLPTGKKHLSSDKGSVLVGRKVRKDFGGSLYGGEIVGYKMYYNVKYDDGDTEDLNWKELEPILLPEEEGSSQSKHGNHNTQNKVNPVKSKTKNKNQ